MQNKTITEILERTINNCKTYEKKGDDASLLNEIGVLRGIAYCLEALGEDPHSPELKHYLKIQNELKETL